LQKEKAAKRLPTAVEVLCMYQDDAWFRDTGPTVSIDPEP
jgi:agmatine/peptidylarginine deiminase